MWENNTECLVALLAIYEHRSKHCQSKNNDLVLHEINTKITLPFLTSPRTRTVQEPGIHFCSGQVMLIIANRNIPLDWFNFSALEHASFRGGMQ